MGDLNSTVPAYEGEEHVIAAAQHILKALGANKNLDDDLRKTILDLGTHLSAMVRLTEENGWRLEKFEKQLKISEDKVMKWESKQCMIWDCGSRETSLYLNAVDEIQALIDNLQNLLSVDGNWKQKELLQRAGGILQIAMSKLEEELLHTLVQHKQYFEPECMAFHSTGVDIEYDESFDTVQGEATDEVANIDSAAGDAYKDYTVDLVSANIIPDLKSIANAMFASKYHHEFCRAFVSSRRDALDEYFVILELEALNVEDVTKMEWKSMELVMKKWIRAMNIIVRVYLPSEKRLCEQILGDLGSAHTFCFSEISKAPMLRLLNLGEAMAMGNFEPEKLFRFLDSYEILVGLNVDVDKLFFEEVGFFVRIEFHKLVRRICEFIRATLTAFENAIATNPSNHPFPRGGVHHLTKYVMNYIRILTEYRDSVNLLLQDKNSDSSTENEHDISTCPMGCFLQSVISTLESNLSNKSKSYGDVALQHIFMMNNLHYMVQKVKGAELRLYLGDQWIRQHNAKFQQHAMRYERVTWSSILCWLKEDCGSNSSSKSNLKERLKGFNIAFEEVYKTQRGWFVPDLQLREDLQISISQKVVHAFQTFVGRNSSDIKDKYKKYTKDDVEKYILDLFEGSSRSVSYHQWMK